MYYRLPLFSREPDGRSISNHLQVCQFMHGGLHKLLYCQLFNCPFKNNNNNLVSFDKEKLLQIMSVMKQVDRKQIGKKNTHNFVSKVPDKSLVLQLRRNTKNTAILEGCHRRAQHWRCSSDRLY